MKAADADLVYWKSRAEALGGEVERLRKQVLTLVVLPRGGASSGSEAPAEVVGGSLASTQMVKARVPSDLHLLWELLGPRQERPV